MGGLVNLQTLWMERCGFFGTIPTMTLLTQLTSFSFGRQSITGSLREDVRYDNARMQPNSAHLLPHSRTCLGVVRPLCDSVMTSLQSLYCIYCSLSGTLPSNYSTLSKLQR